MFQAILLCLQPHPYTPKKPKKQNKKQKQQKTKNQKKQITDYHASQTFGHQKYCMKILNLHRKTAKI